MLFLKLLLKHKDQTLAGIPHCIEVMAYKRLIKTMENSKTIILKVVSVDCER